MQEGQLKQIKTFLGGGDYASAKSILSDTPENQKDLDYWYYSAHVARKMHDLVRAEELGK